MYQYGEPGSTVDFFCSLSEDDRKRLIYVALIFGDSDIKKVADYLIQRFNLPAKTPEALSSQMSENDRNELLEIIRSVQLAPKKLPKYDRDRIRKKLLEILGLMGSLSFEDAYWLLIPPNPEQNIIIINAVGGSGKKTQDSVKNEIFYNSRRLHSGVLTT